MYISKQGSLGCAHAGGPNGLKPRGHWSSQVYVSGLGLRAHCACAHEYVRMRSPRHLARARRSVRGQRGSCTPHCVPGAGAGRLVFVGKPPARGQGNGGGPARGSHAPRVSTPGAAVQVANSFQLAVPRCWIRVAGYARAASTCCDLRAPPRGPPAGWPRANGIRPGQRATPWSLARRLPQNQVPGSSRAAPTSRAAWRSEDATCNHICPLRRLFTCT